MCNQTKPNQKQPCWMKEQRQKSHFVMKNFIIWMTTCNGGSLGSCIDEERSKLRNVVWIAGFRESSNLRTQMALLGIPGSMSVWVSLTTVVSLSLHTQVCEGKTVWGWSPTPLHTFFFVCVCVCVGVPRSAYRKEKTGSKLAFVFRVFTLFLFVFPFSLLFYVFLRLLHHRCPRNVSVHSLCRQPKNGLCKAS